jgi:DNA polymerase V
MALQFRYSLRVWSHKKVLNLLSDICRQILPQKEADGIGNEVLQKLYRQGYHYKKAGVIVMGIGPNSPIQQDLFDTNAEQFEKMKRLDAVIDRINKVNGTETIVLGSQQYTQKDGKGKANVFANAIKHDFKSKNPTTRWSDIIILK